MGSILINSTPAIYLYLSVCVYLYIYMCVWYLRMSQKVKKICPQQRAMFMGETVVLQHYIGNDGGIHIFQTHSCSGWVLVLPRDRLELATAHSMSRSPGQPHAQAQPKCWREQRMVLTGCPVPNRPQIVKTWTSLSPFRSARCTGTTNGNWAATPMEYGSLTNTARFHQEHRLPSSTCWYLWGFPVGFR